jgi:hypothetical protein
MKERAVKDNRGRMMDILYEKFPSFILLFLTKRWSFSYQFVFPLPIYLFLLDIFATLNLPLDL